MTQEQLMKPRWKVIAAFPDNRNYEVGSILDRDWCRYVNDEDESEGVVWRISDFPHLFKKLEWWEEREEKDMPEYVKWNSCNSGREYIVKVLEIKDDQFRWEEGWETFTENQDFPSTKEEYEQYLQSKK